MRSLALSVLSVLFSLLLSGLADAETIDGRVFQVEMPAEELTLSYVEARSVFTVQLKGKTASVEGEKMYIGDGRVAIELVAHASRGVFLQGVKYKQGDKFKLGATIKLRPGFRKAAELKPGDVYVTVRGVAFSRPDK